VTQFSDPAWWPRRPERAPAPISLARIVFGGLLPLALVAGLIVYSETRHGAAPTTRSLAAYERCARTHRAPHHGGPPPGATCANLLPPGTTIGTFGPPSAAEQRFQLCLQNTVARAPRPRFGGGPPGGGRPGGFDAAVAVCEQLAQSGTGAGTAGGTGTATATTSGSLPKL
jgi:hypothetical protein